MSLFQHEEQQTGKVRPLRDDMDAGLRCDARQQGDLPTPLFRTTAVSVIIPVHKGGEPFRQCLASIQATSPPPDEVIIVTDGEVDGVERCASVPNVLVMHSAEQRGPAFARNLGARAARGDILLFIDADVTVRPSAIDEVRRAFDAQPEVSALVGSYDDAPAEASFFSQYKNLVHHYTHQSAREEGFTFWGACGAIRREVFLEAGGFDEAYRHPSIEDIELGYRLRAAGHRIRMCKHLQVKHLKRWTAASLFGTDFFRRALPWTELILRAGRMDDDLNISRASRFKVILAYALVASFGLSWWWWAGGLALAALAGLVLLTMDLPLLRFFAVRRGVPFALGGLLCHWLYYLYSGLAFALGAAVYVCRRPVARGPALPVRDEALPRKGEQGVTQ